MHVRGCRHGRTETHPYDQLVVAIGAVPIVPDLPGMDADGVFGVQTLDDGEAVLEALDRDPRPKRAVGGCRVHRVEMAEALVRHGLDVTVVEQMDEPMSTLDPDMGRLIHVAMEDLGIDVQTRSEVEGLDTDADGHVRAVSVREFRRTRGHRRTGHGGSAQHRHCPRGGTEAPRERHCEQTCGCGPWAMTRCGPVATACRCLTS